MDIKDMEEGEVKGFFSKQDPRIPDEVYKEEFQKAIDNVYGKKYFTPAIEDIHVGYECEVEWHVFNKGHEWRKLVVDLPLLNLMKNTKSVRVPYLTKEQIEGEGWKYKKNIMNDLWFEKSSINLRARNGQLLVNRVFHSIGRNRSETIFKGQCKDINTFRYICKLIGI